MGQGVRVGRGVRVGGLGVAEGPRVAVELSEKATTFERSEAAAGVGAAVQVRTMAMIAIDNSVKMSAVDRDIGSPFIRLGCPFSVLDDRLTAFGDGRWVCCWSLLVARHHKMLKVGC